MKIAISVPNDVFETGEHLAQKLGLSRSQLYANALSAYLGESGPAAVTAKLNAILGSNLVLSDAPGNVRVGKAEAGVTKPPVVKVSQRYMLDRELLTQRVRNLPAETMRAS